MKNNYLQRHKLLYGATLSILLLSLGFTNDTRHTILAKSLTYLDSNSQEDMSKHFELNGSAKLSDNIYTLTNDQSHQSGTAFLTTPIDFSNDIILDLSVNIGNKQQQLGGGDGLAISFVPLAQIDKVTHADGGALGLGGIPDTFGFKLDTYFNAIGETGRLTPDPNVFGNSQGRGDSFGAFFSSEHDGVIHTDNQNAQAIGFSSHDATFKSLQLEYHKSNNTVEVHYDGLSWHNNTYHFSEPMFLVISAATGDNHNLQQVITKKIDFKPHNSRVTANYFDENQNKLIPSIQISGLINNKYVTRPESIPGYELIRLPDNYLGTFSAQDMTINYYYRPRKHNIVISYIYNNKTIKKDILSAVTSEDVIYSPKIVMNVLKAYQISKTEWLGHFLVPKADTSVWHFKITLTKKSDEAVLPEKNQTQVNRQKYHDKVKNSKESIINKYKLPSVKLNDNLTQSMINRPTVSQQDKIDKVSERLSDHKTLHINTFHTFLTYLKHQPMMKISNQQNLATFDSFPAPQKKDLKQIQPSPVNTNVSYFTQVIMALASYTTFTDR